MSTVWNWTWATVAFGSELAALAGLAVWGFTVPATTPARLALGLGLPLVAAVLWGLFAAPHARIPVAALAVVTKLVVFGAATAALAAAGHPRLAIALAVAALLGALLSGSPEQLTRPAAS